MDKRKYKSPADAFLNLVNDEDIYDDSDIKPSDLHVLRVTKKMDNRNGSRIGHQKFATDKDAFSLLGPENPVSVKVDVFYDFLDCRSVSCVAFLPGTNEEINFVTKNVVYGGEETPISFDEAEPYQTAYKEKIKFHQSTTEGKKTVRGKTRDPRERTKPIDLETSEFNAESILENGGRIAVNSQLARNSKDDIPTRQPTLFIQSSEYGEIPKNE